MNKNTYIFPLHQKIIPKIKSFFSHKYFILILLLLACCIYGPSLFMGYQSDDYMQLLHFNKEISKKMHLESYFNNIADLYAFSGITSGAAIDRGYMPWWAARGSIGSFFRPVASLLLALDYSLWQNYPVIVHIHSLIWFFILITLVYYVYGKINRSAVLAGFSCILFVFNNTNTWPVVFIANRHIITSAAFSFASFLAYIRYSEQRKGLFLFLSYTLFIAGLLTSEIGITICAFLFSFSLFLDKNPPGKKIVPLVPFVIIVVIWRTFTTLSGYGVYDQFLYIDPLNNPLEFLNALMIRYPLHLLSVILFPVSEILLLSAPSIHILLSLSALCVIVLLFFIFYPFLKKGKPILFWLLTVLLSIVPSCMGMPSSRLLLFPCIGFTGLFGILMKDITGNFSKKAISFFHSFSIRIIVPLLLILYLMLNPLLIIMHYADFLKAKEYRAGLVDFGDILLLNKKTIVVVKPPDTSAMVTGLFERAFTQKTVPEFVRFLSSGMQPLELYRTDEKTLSVKPEGGYNILPSVITEPATGKKKYFGDQFFFRWMETLYYNPEFRWKKGDTVRLTGLVIKVKDVTVDGRILETLFEFEEPLESNVYEWIIWDPHSGQDPRDPHSDQDPRDPHSDQDPRDPHSDQDPRDPHSGQDPRDPSGSLYRSFSLMNIGERIRL